MTDVDKTADMGGSLIAASKVNRTSVYDHGGEKLGSIYDVMINKSSGKAVYAIMSFGGFVGMANSYHPLPWQHLTYDERQGGDVVDIDRARLEGAPSYAADAMTTWSNPRLRSQGRRLLRRDHHLGPGHTAESMATATDRHPPEPGLGGCRKPPKAQPQLALPPTIRGSYCS